MVECLRAPSKVQRAVVKACGRFPEQNAFSAFIKLAQLRESFP
jgi:hypothetical protein